MKRVPIFLILTLLIFCSFVSTPVSYALEAVYRASVPDQSISHPPLEWTLRPGESLKSLAKLIYPHQHRVQLQFIRATKQLNRDIFSIHIASHVFENETSILIPDLRQVSATPKPKNKHSSHQLKYLKSVVLQPPLPHHAVETSAQSNELKTLTSRNEALQQQEKALAEKMSTLEENLRQLEYSLQHRPETPSATSQVKLVPVRVAATEKINPVITSSPTVNQPSLIGSSFFTDLIQVTKELFNFSFMVMLVTVGIAITAIFGMWLRQKKYKKRAEAPEFIVKPAPLNSVLPSLIFDNPAPSTPSTTLSSALSVDEIASVVEEAKIFVGMGRDDHAIHILVDYTLQHPRTSPEPWIYLLEIYRMKHRQDDFIKTAEQFHIAFNVEAPLWETTKPAKATISLEDYPQIISRITAVWPTQAAMEIIDELLLDNRSGERQGFHLEILQELLLLKYLLETRDEFAKLKPF